MEILIIIIIGGIILYLVFEDKTGKKYKKGITALQANNLDLAEQYFKEISEKHKEANSKLEEITFKRGEISEHAGDLEKAYEYFSIIQNNNSKAAARLVEIDFTRGLSAKKSGDLDAAYNFFSKIASNSKKAFVEASKIDFNRGVTAEFSKTYSLAKEYYSKSSLCKDDVKVHYGSICRNLICDLKSDSLPAKNEVSEIYNSPVDKNFKNDFLYRYAVKLIKCDKLTYASEIINNKFESSIPEVSDLESFVFNYKKTQLKHIILEINNSLFTQENNSLLIETIYNKIEIYKNIIEEFPEYSSNIFEIQKNLFSKLISQYISEQEFEKCLEHIISFPNFYENVELLKNAGICCIRILLDKKINESNYKKIISIGLTSIYNDDIFINSLENTTWDDNYTFTVNKSIGKYDNWIYKRDWSNINRDLASDTNIAIGDSQRELLNLFEKALNDIQAENLHNKIYSFYTEEKKSITNLVKLLGYDVLHTTPEFSKIFKAGEILLKRLQSRYETKSNEEILKLGAEYFTLTFNEKGTGVTLQGSTLIEKYASAKWYANRAINEIKKKEIVSDPQMYKNIISQFHTIQSIFENDALQHLLEFISQGESNEKTINLLRKACQIIPESEKASYLFADYTTTYCIDKINSKSIKEIKALELFFDAITTCPENHRTSKNLAIFISLNLTDYAFSNKIKSLLSSLKSIQSECLYDSFQAELLPLSVELKSLMKKPNINYTRVNETINLIDELINSVEPF